MVTRKEGKRAKKRGRKSLVGTLARHMPPRNRPTNRRRPLAPLPDSGELTVPILEPGGEEHPERIRYRPGRPRRAFDGRDYKLVADLVADGNSYEAIARYLGVGKNTVVRRMQDDPWFRAAYEEGLGLKEISLRRMQRGLARRSAAMSIFLGVNELGQHSAWTRSDVSVGVGSIAELAAVAAARRRAALESGEDRDVIDVDFGGDGDLATEADQLTPLLPPRRDG